jgi:hypothetical protein
MNWFPLISMMVFLLYGINKYAYDILRCESYVYDSLVIKTINDSNLYLITKIITVPLVGILDLTVILFRINYNIWIMYLWLMLFYIRLISGLFVKDAGIDVPYKNYKHNI